MGPLLLLTSSALTAARNNGWSNSTSGVHTFGLWSFHEKDADLSAFDFVCRTTASSPHRSVHLSVRQRRAGKALDAAASGIASTPQR